MPKTLKELQDQMVGQLKRRGFYPKDDKEVLLRLGEEVGEVIAITIYRAAYAARYGGGQGESE